MGERHRVRELGVRALYQSEVSGLDLMDSLRNVLEHEEHLKAREAELRAEGQEPEQDDEALEPVWLGPDSRRYLEEVLTAYETHRVRVDAALEAQAEHWSLKRMAVTDRNVLRWAATELWFRPDVPRAVVLDEAVELAKELSGPSAGKFVNGVLDRLPDAPPDA